MATSMTGFGRNKIDTDEGSVTVEIKSVNHRFLEFNIRIPRQFMYLEDKIRKKLTNYLLRGRIEVFISIEGTGLFNEKVNVNWHLLDQLQKTVKEMKDRYPLSGELSVSDVLHIKEILSVDEEIGEDEKLETLILKGVEEAAKQLLMMRRKEGEALTTQLLQLNEKVDEKCQLLRKKAPIVVELYRERLQKRMNEFTNGQIDEIRLVNEVAIFADKADITEELSRLNSHIAQFRHILTSDGAIGRRLDFLLQEMNREINTIGSKGNDSEIATMVVDLKSILEKMREQVQNIE